MVKQVVVLLLLLLLLGICPYKTRWEGTFGHTVPRASKSDNTLGVQKISWKRTPTALLDPEKKTRISQMMHIHALYIDPVACHGQVSHPNVGQ